MYSIAQLEKLAKCCGALYKRTMYNDCSIWLSLDRKEPYSVHYFNHNNEEVCYYIVSCGVYKQSGLVILETPRHWDKDLYNNKLCGVLTKLENN